MLEPFTPLIVKINLMSPRSIIRGEIRTKIGVETETLTSIVW